MTTNLANQIAAWCDTQDREHASTTCPGGPDCIHAAVTAIRALLVWCDELRRPVGIHHLGTTAADQILTRLAGPLGIKENSRA